MAVPRDAVLPDLGEPSWEPRRPPDGVPRPAWLSDPRVTTAGARAIGLELSGAWQGAGASFLLRLQRRRARRRDADA